MAKNWQFISSGHCPPALNMAVDETLLDIYLASSVPVFRIYGWNPHGFSLGCSQKAEQVLDAEKCRNDNIPFVRRATGGGIIFHGNEVTYSIVCSEEDIGCPSSIKEGYRIICSFLIEAYKRYGLDPYFAIERQDGQEKIKSTFCFSSFEDYDILVKGKKIGGNAQKRKKKLILQHGSIPLSYNMLSIGKYVREPLFVAKKNSISLEQAVDREVSFEEFSRVMRESFISVFNASFQERDFSESEYGLINKSLDNVNSRT